MPKKTLDGYGDLLNIEDVLEYLSCGKPFIYRAIKEKRLKALKIAKRWRIPKQELVRFIDSFKEEEEYGKAASI